MLRLLTVDVLSMNLPSSARAIDRVEAFARASGCAQKKCLLALRFVLLPPPTYECGEVSLRAEASDCRV